MIRYNQFLGLKLFKSITLHKSNSSLLYKDLSIKYFCRKSSSQQKVKKSKLSSDSGSIMNNKTTKSIKFSSLPNLMKKDQKTSKAATSSNKDNVNNLRNVSFFNLISQYINFGVSSTGPSGSNLSNLNDYIIFQNRKLIVKEIVKSNYVLIGTVNSYAMRHYFIIILLSLALLFIGFIIIKKSLKLCSNINDSTILPDSKTNDNPNANVIYDNDHLRMDKNKFYFTMSLSINLSLLIFIFKSFRSNLGILKRSIKRIYYSNNDKSIIIERCFSIKNRMECEAFESLKIYEYEPQNYYLINLNNMDIFSKRSKYYTFREDYFDYKTNKTLKDIFSPILNNTKYQLNLTELIESASNYVFYHTLFINLAIIIIGLIFSS